MAIAGVFIAYIAIKNIANFFIKAATTMMENNSFMRDDSYECTC